MPFIQVFNVHSDLGVIPGSGRRASWRGELAEAVEKRANEHLGIDGRYTEIFIGHDPSIPKNAPITVIVNWVREDRDLDMSSRAGLASALGSFLETEV